MTLPLTLGERMALYRRRSKLKPGQMAARLHVAVRTIHAWENDQNKPPDTAIETWATVCNIPLVELEPDLAAAIGEFETSSQQPGLPTGRSMLNQQEEAVHQSGLPTSWYVFDMPDELSIRRDRRRTRRAECGLPLAQ